MWPAPTPFTLADVGERLKAVAKQVANGADEEPDMAELRRFCTAPRASAPTKKAISAALKAIEDTPTKAGDAVLTLRRQGDIHGLAFKVIETKP